MTTIKNLIGNIRLLFVFLFLVNCSKQQNYSKLGNQLISDHRDVLFDSLWVFDNNTKHNIEINKNVNFDSLMFYNFNHTKIDSSLIKRLEIENFNFSNFREFKILPESDFYFDDRCFSFKDNAPNGKVIKLNIFNFYYDEKNGKSFLMVSKSRKGGIGHVKDVYFFKKTNNVWIFIKKYNISYG